MRKDSRSRLGKLASVEAEKLKAIVADLHAAGKEASEAAVLRELKGDEIKAKRADYEGRADKGANVGDLIAMADAGQRFNVIYADPPWQFKVYSGKGKQRSADRYYDTSSLEAIKALPIERLAAPDCALFLWGVWPLCGQTSKPYQCRAMQHRCKGSLRSLFGLTLADAR